MNSPKHWFLSSFRRIVFAASLLSISSRVTAAPSDRVEVVRVPDTTHIMRAERSANGIIHILFDPPEGPQYVCSKDDGRTFSTPSPVVDAASRKPGLEYATWDMAVDRDGRVHVALGTNAWKLKLPQEEWGLHYTVLEAGTGQFSPVRNLNHKPSEGYSLATDSDGRVTANFLSGKLYTMTSRDGGQNFSAYSEIDPAFDPCKCCTTSATFGSDGKMAVLYREESNNLRDMYLVLADPRGDSPPTRTKVSAVPWKLEGCPMTYFTIRGTPAGYIAAWPTKGDIYFAKLDRNGAVLPPGEIKTPGRCGIRTGILALSAGDGATLVAWKNQEILGWQFYDAQSVPQGRAGTTASAGSGAAGVVLPSGKFLLFP